MAIIKYKKENAKVRTNYSRFEKPKETKTELEKEVQTSPVKIPEVSLSKGVYPKATVIGCIKLNVRSAPNKLGNILAVIDQGSNMLVRSTKDYWAHIYTDSGIDGYVMEEFIKEEL